MRIPPPSKFLLLFALVAAALAPQEMLANGNVHVSRFWHNHQPVYWPEWMGDGSEPNRGQLAWDSIQKKPLQNYGGLSPVNHPENNLTDIFGHDDRRNAYQDGPRNSLNTFSGGGFAMSYSGALMDNVRQLGGGGHLGYGSGWNSGNTQARGWGRLDLVGFTFHHSLAPLLPKEVFRKEVQIFKQAWWKAWGGNADLSDHSKGFFPTEMAYTRDIIDVLVDEGYEWVIVASHHISRTSPSYNDRANPEGTYGIYSSPPNKADQLGPTTNDGWWYGAGQVEAIRAWNLAPFAYQLHKVQYVNPNTGTIKEMVAVPSDDVISYQYGYGNEGLGKVQASIAPFANDPNRPVIIMPATDGDNAWGGGSSSWMDATPQLFNSAASAGYVKSMPGTFVDQFKQHAPVTHIEDGAWIFPESDYGSPNFMKWIEPPLYNAAIGATNRYPGTQADMESPGYALKFFSYAPLMAGANWVITAEQILKDEGGQVRPWVVHAPYGVGGGEYSDRNDVELAWHIYLRGLDSGFNYYGGLGNDDEVKPSLATKRAVDRLRNFMSTRMNEDRTGPTALKPQRFPYNPGAYTFGWFNNIPGDTRFLKKMPSFFYIWTHVYDVSGVASVNLKIRRDKDGVRSLQNTHNETYAGGGDVEEWVTIPMTKRTLPNTRTALNAAASNGQIDFFVYDPAFQPTTGIEIADYYFAKIDDAVIPGFRSNLFDYYVESTDTRGNVSRSEIQHVWVEDDGETPSSGAQFSPNPNDCEPFTVTYYAANGPLEDVDPIVMQISFDGGDTWDAVTMDSSAANVWTTTVEAPDNAPSATVWFRNSASTIFDSRDGQNWTTTIRDCEAPDGPVWTVPFTPVAGEQVTVNYNPEGRILASAPAVYIHHGYNGSNWTTVPGVPMTKNGAIWSYSYTVPANATSITVVFNNGAGTWDNNGSNDWTFAVTDMPVTDPPPTPTGLQGAAASSTSISLTWSPASTASSYKVFRNGSVDPVATVGATNFTDTGLSPETTYSYRISAVNSAGESALSAQVEITTQFLPVDSDSIRISHPVSATPVTSDTTTFTYSGVAGASLLDGLSWTNLLTGASGSVPYTGSGQPGGWQWFATVPLGDGDNVVRFAADYSFSGTVTNASDSPVNAGYAGGWTNGSTGGSGFGAWTLSATGSGGHFHATVAAANMNTGLSNGFGLWANGGGVSTATRTFNTPMGVGGKFNIRFDNNSIQNGSSVGVALADAGSTNRVSFYFVGGQATYRVSDAVTNRDTGISYTSEGLDLTFELLTTDTYQLTAGTNVFTGTLAAAGLISRLVASNNNAGAGPDYDVFLGAMSLTAEVDESGSTATNAPAVTRSSGGFTDGIPDSWWDQYNIAPEHRVASADPDGDGFTNAEEHALGTDPTDPGSRFRITSIVRDGDTTTVTWTSVPGRAYRLYTTTSLTNPDWQPVGEGPLTAENGTESESHTSAEACFYRVHLVVP